MLGAKADKITECSCDVFKKSVVQSCIDCQQSVILGGCSLNFLVQRHNFDLVSNLDAMEQVSKKGKHNFFIEFQIWRVKSIYISTTIILFSLRV